MKKGLKQLNTIQRAKLQTLLKVKKSLQEISDELGVSRQTLYREILRNSYHVSKDTLYVKSSCIHYLECLKGQSRLKFACPNNCIKYEPGRQDCLKKYPFTCNNCRKKAKCTFLHYYYDPEKASNEYHLRLQCANDGPKTKEADIKKIDKIVSPLVKKGQSVEAILMNHPEINVSALTIRNWIAKGILNCKLSELRMTGRRKPSSSYNYSKKHDYTILSSKKIGHKYTDYRLYISEHPNALVIQLDTVIGCIDGKYSVLTIHIVNYRFQFGILLEAHTKDEVFKKLSELFASMKEIETAYGMPFYSTFTEVILTDNGPEFDALLNFCDQDSNIHVFYCHPLSSFEKGACERNHVLVRYIQYKGWTFDGMNQDDIQKLFSNINSYPRKSLNGKTPYQCVEEDTRFGKEFLDLIGINKIPCDDVILNPSLLKSIKK